jgi:hypothetical protein
MMKMRKTRVSMALGAVLGAAALAPATSFGWSVDTGAGDLDTSSGGDTLLFPVYTTAASATTSFSVTNTSSQTVLAKIRFREQIRSMDVLDFFAILSPYDKFDFWVERPNGDERPSMGWDDNTCVVGPAGDRVQFPAPSPWVDTSEQMQLGHLEVLGVADLTNVYTDGSGNFQQGSGGDFTISIAGLAKHDSNGVPPGCATLVDAFASPQIVANMNSASVGEDVGNVLVGRYVITGAGVGIEGGGDAIGIQDSDLGPPNLPISAQSGADCLPSNCTQNYEWDGAEWDHPHLGEMTNLAGFQDALTASNIAGDWSNNPVNDVGVDWVLSFPSKYAYLDIIDAADCAGGASSGTEWCLLVDTQTTNGNSGAWTDASTADLCVNDNGLRVFDTEESQASGNVNVSPGTRTTLDICNEMQVFTLAAVGDTPRDSVIQTAARRGVIEFENLDAARGWAEMGLNFNTQGDGTPAISGIIFTTRATEDPTINNGSITDLQKNVGGDD